MNRADILGRLQGPTTPKTLQQTREAIIGQDARRQLAAQSTGPGQVRGPQAAQELGSAVAQATGQVATEAVKQEGAQQVAAGQQVIGNQAHAAQMEQQERTLALGKRQQELETAFSKLARNEKAQLYDRAMAFQRDEQGRAHLNERQLMDFALAKGLSEEQWKDYAQAAELATRRELQIMEASYRKIEQLMQQESFKTRTDISNAAKKELAETRARLEQEMRRKQARAQNRGNMFSTVGTIVMAGAGFAAAPYLGVGAGSAAILGSKLGEGFGRILASQ